MMRSLLKKMIALISAAVILSALLVAVVRLTGPDEVADYKRAFKKMVKASLQTKEDPYARYTYERMRLVNPETGVIPAEIRRKELQFAEKLPVKGVLEGPVLNKTTVGMAPWELRGPFNVGGRTRALALDVTDESTILAGGVSGGMWISDNGGDTWEKTTQPGQLHSVTCLDQDRREGKTNVWYYGTGEPIGNSATKGGAWFSGDGIFKSTDGGYTWDVLPSTSTNTPQTYENFFDYIWNVKTDPSNGSQDEVYAAVSGGIFRSLNGGGNWSASKVSSTSTWAYYTDVAVTSNGVVYATLSSEGASDAGIWRSTDGQNWVKITPLNWPGTYRRTVIGIAPSNENVVYFLSDTPGGGTSNHSLWKYTYLSGDGSGSGGAWEDRSTSIPNEGGNTGDFSSQNSYDLVIHVKPDNEDVVFIGGINLYRSDNGFADKAQTKWIGGYTKSNDSFNGYPNHHPDQHALVFYPSDPNQLLSGHDGGISYTDDCLAADVSWSKLNRGYYTTQFYTIAIDPTGTDDVIIGGTQDNGTYWVRDNSDASTNWMDVFGGDGSYCAVAPGKSHYYVSFQNGETYRLALDNSGNWQGNPARVDPAGGENYLFINPFIIDPNVPERMYLAGGSLLWRNSDVTALPAGNYEPISQNWTELTNSEIPGGSVSALDVSVEPADRLYYGTTQGKVYRIDDADSGNPEAADLTSVSFPAGYVSCIEVDPTDADRVLIVFSNYEVISMWYSENGGSDWMAVSGNLEQNVNGSGNGPSVRWAEILPTDEGTIYFAGTSTGLYSTTQMNGASTVWTQEGATTIGNVVIDMVTARRSDNRVVVATHGNGVYSSIAGATPVEGNEPFQAVSSLYLEQNYPNPFNPSTTIRYSIPEANEVELDIFDIQGRSVATLVRGNQAAGNHSIRWNGRDRFGIQVPAGIYIYRLKAGSLTASKQMIVLK